MNEAPRYAGLRDYLRVVRTQRLLILLCITAFAGAALALALREVPSYRATATLSFKDPNTDASLLGTSAGPFQEPQQRAAINAELATRPTIARRVKRQLHTKQSSSALAAAVTARVEAQTNLVDIEARSSDRRMAAKIANGFASAVRDVETDKQRARFGDAASTMRKRFDALTRRSRNPYTRAVVQDRLSRLEALRDFAQPVSVAKRARVPVTPVSPRPVRNALLGALIGLAFGLLAAFVRDSLDRRLRGSRDVQESLHLPVLGVILDQAMGRVGFQVNGNKPLKPADLDAFRIVRANVEFLDSEHPPRCVMVTSAVAEEGKSTVAASLAHTTAAAGKRVLLVECDLRRPALGKRLGLAPAPGLSDYLAGHAEPRGILQTLRLSEPGGDEAPETVPEHPLTCIVAGGAGGSPAELLGSDRFREFLREVREVYDVIVLDCPPVLSVVDALQVAPLADAVIVCIRAGRTTEDQAQAAKAALARVPERPVGLVVTGVKPRDEAVYGYYAYPGRRQHARA